MRFIQFVAIAILFAIIVDFSARFFVEDTTAASINGEFSHPDLFTPDVYAQMKANLDHVRLETPSTTVSTNSFGMRMGEVALEKKEGVTRVAVLGGSAAFGLGVPQEQAFPAQLQKRLDSAAPEKYAVLNFSAPGYASFQLLKQYERVVHQFSPDVLILAAGMADSEFSKISDLAYYSLLDEFQLLSPPAGFGALLEKISFVGNWAGAQSRRANWNELQKKKASLVSGDAWKRRATNQEFVQFIEAVIKHRQEQGGKVVLINANLKSFSISPAFQELAQTNSVPLLDLRDLVDEASGQDERKKRFELGLKPSGHEPGATGAVIRFYLPSAPPGSPQELIIGNAPGASGVELARIALFDNGANGDEIANDRVWSALVMRENHDLNFSLVPDEYKNNPNQLFFHRIPAERLRDGYTYISNLIIGGHVPFQDLALVDDPTLPNAKLHLSIAKRLESIVLKTAQ